MDAVAVDILLTLLFLGLTIWVAIIAKENGRDMWLSVVISLVFTPIVSLVVYLILGKKSRENRKARPKISRSRSQKRPICTRTKARPRKSAA